MRSILLIIKELAAFEDSHSKHDSYPEMVRLHQQLAESCYVLPLRFYTPSQRAIFENSSGIDSQTKLISGAWRIPDKILNAFFRDNSYNGLMRYFKIKYYFTLKAVENYFKTNSEPEVITALHSCDESGIVARLISEQFNIPFVVMERKTAYARQKLKGGKRELLCDTFSRANFILPVSNALGKRIVELCPHADLNIHPIPNPSATSLFENTQPSEEVLTFAEGRFVYAGWTNWRPIKRLDLLVEAFCKAREQRNDICLVVAGRIPDQVWRSLPSGEWQEHALFLGHIDKPSIKALSAASDCCVIPSDHETFGLPAIEALSAGIPAIVTSCGGPEEIITEDNLGRVVACGDSQGLADAMLEIRESIANFKPQELKSYCQKDFGYQRILSEWKNIYARVLEERKPKT